MRRMQNGSHSPPEAVYGSPAVFVRLSSLLFIRRLIRGARHSPCGFYYSAAKSNLIPLAPRDWHVHEMLYGYVPAVVTGFLLTAIPNWTGRLPLQGTPLIRAPRSVDLRTRCGRRLGH